MLSSTAFASMLLRKSTPISRTMFKQQQLMMNSRAFGSYSRVCGNSIIISNHHPAKLRIPASEDQQLQYDFSLDSFETVKQFEDKVKANASGINKFRVIVEG